MRLLLVIAFAVTLAAQPVDESLVFLPAINDIGRYLYGGRSQHLSRWNPTKEAASQLEGRRQTRSPWSETTPPILKLVRVETLSATEAVLLCREGTVSPQMIDQWTRVRIYFGKVNGQWRLTSYQTMPRVFPARWAP
ncbi:MAG: hypothetical protein HY820_08715 [Acidobacteria bacterium]|nr:hypothetical protein [Acidobacteriota bacterium]